MARRKIPPIDRFWNKVDKTPGHGPKGDCWIWTGSVSNRYGHCHWEGKQPSAHCVSYALACGGPPPKGYWVLHRCDNPLCVRPDHLFLGTAQDNSSDMIAKGRSLHGARNGRAVLTDNNVVEARKRRDAEGWSWRRLANHFGVCPSTIRSAVLGETFKHV